MMTRRNDMPDHDLAACSQPHHGLFRHDGSGDDSLGHDGSGVSDGRAARFRMLRRDAARLEGRSGTARIPLGVGPLDSALAGGLALGRVHLLSGRPGHDGALTGFTVALLRRLLARQDEATPTSSGFCCHTAHPMNTSRSVSNADDGSSMDD